MPVQYSYLKYKDTYTITNNSNSVNLTCTITDTLNSNKITFQKLIAPNTTIEIVFKYDSIYNILLDDSTSQTNIEVRYYENLLQLILNKIEMFLCNCGNGCNECDECDKCDDILDLITLCYSYEIIFNESLYSIINSINNLFNNDFIALSSCNILETTFILNNKNIEVIKNIISFYYLAFYMNEKFKTIDTEEKVYIDNKFRISKFKKCIKKLGLNVDDIENNVLEFLNNQLKPSHVSIIKYKSDFNTKKGIPKSLILLNYEDINGNLPKYIKFNNISQLNCTLTLTNGDSIIEGEEYDLSLFNSVYYPEVIGSSNLETNFPNCVCYITTPESFTSITIEYGIRNTLSEIYNDKGKIIIDNI